MAPKNKCLRCPANLVDDYRHKDLARCQKDIEVDGKPYSIEHLWPDFDGTESAEHDNLGAAREFVNQITHSVQAGEPQPWSKETMEAAAQLGFPESDANKSKQKSKSTVNDSSSSDKAGEAGPSNTATPASAQQPFETPSSRISSSPGASQPASFASKTAPHASRSGSVSGLSGGVGATGTGIGTDGASSASTSTNANLTTKQPQSSNQATNDQYIQTLAGRLANSEHDNQQRRNLIAPTDRTSLNSIQRDNMKPEMIQKFGLRTNFTTHERGLRVEANYLAIPNNPKELHVYNVEIVRHYDANGNPVLVRKQWDKLEVLHQIMRVLPPNASHIFPAYNAMAQALWNIRTAGATHPNQSAVPIAVTPPGPVLQYENETGNLLTVARVGIDFRQTIDLTGAIGDLFYDATSPSYRDSAPEILTRGLNAFFTKHVRDRSDPPRPVPSGAPPPTFTCVGLNKSFPATAGGFVLDGQGEPVILRGNSGFYLSVRPGISNLHVNISSATSPFLQDGISVQHYIQRCIGATHNRSLGEAFAILKGVKVRISYNTINDSTTFPNANSRFRFIKTIAAPATPANVSQRWRAPTCITASQWYAPSSPWAVSPDFPRPALNLHVGEYYINVGKDPVTRPNEVEWYPASQLTIRPWQPFRARLSGTQTTNMISRALRQPTAHQENLLGKNPGEGLHHFAFDGNNAGKNQGGLHLARWSTGNSFVRIAAKWLNPPGMRYSMERDLNNTAQDAQRANAVMMANINAGNPASWNLAQVGFVAPGRVTTLPVLALNNAADPSNVGRPLRDQLRRHGQFVGAAHTVQVPPSTMQIHRPKLSTQWENDFSQALLNVSKKAPRQTVLVVIPNNCFDDYACIKRIGDLSLGIHTVCITRDVARRMINANGGQVASNLAMKFNIKARGDNHYFTGNALNALRTLNHRAHTIVLGADVTHPGDTSVKATPSIAAVVGSVDDQFMRFLGSMRLQPGKKEDIVDLADMIKERILAWAAQHNNQLPRNVLFYRDGVSESQYDILRRRELPQIQLGMNLAHRELHSLAHVTPSTHGVPPAEPTIPYPLPKKSSAAQVKEYEEDVAGATEAHPDNRPLNVTYIVVGKRHHTRFYPVGAQPPPTRNGNVKPGLVVDRVITHPYRMDFYLQSHLPIQGTGRSAHYVVLRNGMDLTADQIQTITHTFCYAYARATRGVSYCAPAYYADRLCDRGRAYIRRWLINSQHAPAFPGKNQHETWPQYVLRMKNFVYSSAEYRPHGNHGIPNRANPWHPNLDNTMFYL